MTGLVRSALSALALLSLISSILGLAPSFAIAAEPGPSVQALQQAFPRQRLYQVNEQSFRQIVARHGFEGQLLIGPALALAVSTPNSVDSVASTAPSASTAKDSGIAGDSIPIASANLPDSVQAPRALREYQERSRRKDSLTHAHLRKNLLYTENDSAFSADESANKSANESEADASATKERVHGYFQNFFLDFSNANWGGKWDGADWAAVIYVVVGVVVVGAFIVYGVHTIYEIVTNSEGDPIFKEIGLRYSYSGKQWSDGGPPLYRNANLMGIRLAMGLDRHGMGLGVAVEGGYIDLSLQNTDIPTEAFHFQGGYMVAGPIVRFGNNKPASLTFEFLNGASNQPSIGWISKSRMAVQGRVNNSGLLLGAHLGAVFYDLKFYDGLIQHRGQFNRDLSLVMGIDTGWEF